MESQFKPESPLSRSMLISKILAAQVKWCMLSDVRSGHLVSDLERRLLDASWWLQCQLDPNMQSASSVSGKLELLSSWLRASSSSQPERTPVESATSGPADIRSGERWTKDKLSEPGQQSSDLGPNFQTELHLRLIEKLLQDVAQLQIKVSQLQLLVSWHKDSPPAVLKATK